MNGFLLFGHTALLLAYRLLGAESSFNWVDSLYVNGCLHLPRGFFSGKRRAGRRLRLEMMNQASKTLSPLCRALADFSIFTCMVIQT